MRALLTPLRENHDLASHAASASLRMRQKFLFADRSFSNLCECANSEPAENADWRSLAHGRGMRR